MPAADCCRLLNADYSTLSRFPPRGAFSDRRQLSRGKLNHLQCTTAASTLRALDGYGLRHLALARPTLTPLMRFLFIGSHLCSTLPSDLASRQMPLRFAILHLHQVECGTSTRRVVEHARHTLLHVAPLALRNLSFHTLEIAISVRGEKVECSINNKVVASYDKSALVTSGKLKSTDGVYASASHITRKRS